MSGPHGFEAALFGDDELAAMFSDAAAVRRMLEVETALARAQAALGMIPLEAARGIEAGLAGFDVDMAKLRAGVARDGMPVPALTAQLRAALSDDAAQWLHFGSTSQDIIDTGLILQLKDALLLIEDRLEALIDTLCALARTHSRSVMLARTRSQAALPTTFGLKAACWLAPLVRHRHRLAELRARVLLVQCGGAAGTLAAMEGHGVAVMEGLARELDLACPPLPWHAQRDGLLELAGWLASLTGALGKLGQDCVLLAQSEVGELREGEAGGSSTLPQKANPIRGESLVTLARHATGLLANLHSATIQEHERGGAGWSLEWLNLPPLVITCGAALRQAQSLLGSLEIDTDRMRENLARTNGLVLAEAASFALRRHLPREEAQRAVKAAAREVMESGRHLMDVLAERTTAPVRWDLERDPLRHVGEAEALIERVLSEVERSRASKERGAASIRTKGA